VLERGRNGIETIVRMVILQLLPTVVELALIVGVLFYNFLLLIRGTRSVQILIGLFFVAAGYYVARLAGLVAVSTLIEKFLIILPFALVVLFAPEIRRALAFDVAASFFAVLSAEQLRDAASRRIEVAQATVSDARTKLEAGLASSNDLTRAELELATAQLALTEAQNAVVSSRLSLGYLIAAPADRPLVEPPAEPSEAASADELEQVAQEARADLKELTLRAESLRLLSLEPTLRAIPTLTLRGTYRGTNEAGLSGRERDWNVAALLNWEIFDGGTRYAEAAARRAEYREALLNADALRRRIGLEIRTAQTDLATSRAALEQAEVRARVADQNAREVRVRYSEGLATALEQADATVAAFEAAAELARQRFALGIARLSLSRALGRWPAAVAAVPVEPAAPAASGALP